MGQKLYVDWTHPETHLQNSLHSTRNPKHIHALAYSETEVELANELKNSDVWRELSLSTEKANHNVTDTSPAVQFAAKTHLGSASVWAASLMFWVSRAGRLLSVSKNPL